MNNRSTPPATADMTSWLIRLAVRMLARSLNMPEPLVHHAGVFVFAQVQAVETRAASSLCPIRLLRRFQNWLAPSSR